nr:alpha,alpha-trehalase TreF [Komagataeibacter xylinus]
MKVLLLCGSNLSRSAPRQAGLVLASLLYAGAPALAQTAPESTQATPAAQTPPVQPPAAIPSAPTGTERTAAAPSAPAPAASPDTAGEQIYSVPTPEPLSGSGSMPPAPTTTPPQAPPGTATPAMQAGGSAPATPQEGSTPAMPASPGSADHADATPPGTQPAQTMHKDGPASSGSSPVPPADALLSDAAALAALAQDLRPPSIALDGLFQAIGEAHIYTDAKTAADAIPDEAPADLMAQYNLARQRPDFSLKDFVAQHFTLPERKTVSYQRTPDENVRDYIVGMWEVLSRPPDTQVAYSSQLPLPFTYVVPGGRFSELYYWDSYFTMIGLYENQKIDLMRDMVRDMASMIDRYGHIPNGSRTYYLSRSQAPFFSLMVDLLAMHDGQVAYTTFLPELQAEYDYWMDGQDSVAPGGAYRHVVRLPDGTIMNRHWDDRDTPRDESYPQDIATAAESGRPKNEVYRDLRAGSETGWDFSSRWLADGHTLSTIHTTELLTVELNFLIPHLQQTLAHAYDLKGNKEEAARYAHLAEERINAAQRILWDERRAAYIDYDWKKGESTSILSGATVVPLFLQMATPEQAKAVSETVRKNLLKVGGLIATERTNSGQQWDSPNGWAPLQWMAVKGFNQYGYDQLASDIAARWMGRVIGTYEKSGVLLEKYDVVNPYISPKGGKGGGEYPMQIGFGWTNGTLLGLMNRYPQNTRVVLDRNPAADQPSPLPLPPMNAYGVQSDADALNRYTHQPTVTLAPRPVAPTPTLPQVSSVGASAPTAATEMPPSPAATQETAPADAPATPPAEAPAASATPAEIATPPAQASQPAANAPATPAAQGTTSAAPASAPAASQPAPSTAPEATTPPAAQPAPAAPSSDATAPANQQAAPASPATPPQPAQP